MQRAAWLTFAASAIFWGFFQISKSPMFVGANPFADDPVDAIGSIAVQVALAVSLLTLARAAQMTHAPAASTYKSRLIVRGNSVAFLAIGVTLVADTFMELQHPTWDASIWGRLLVAGLGAVALIACAAGLATVAAARQLGARPASQRPASGEAGSLSEALGDLWALTRRILAWFGHSLPWLDRPRFCAMVALAAGVALAAAHALEEGPPPNLTLGVLVSSIFIGVEFVAVLMGYLVLGGFLGLRPPLRPHRR